MQKHQFRKSLPWEQQHISSVRVIGIVREVIPISFSEIHFVVDCDTSSKQKTEPSSSSSPSSTATTSRNWVDVHATGTWAARCGLLVVGDRVELQHFGVFRPVTASQIATEQLMISKQQQNVSNSPSSVSGMKTNSSNDKKDQVLDSTSASSNKTVHFWEVPEHRMCAPFVLSPVVLTKSDQIESSPIGKSSGSSASSRTISDTPITNTMSTFIVERGQKLILHDEDDQRQNYDGLAENTHANDGTFSKVEDRRRQQMSTGETNLRTQGSHTPQQLFVQTAQKRTQQTESSSQHNQHQKDKMSPASSSSSNTKITSIGNSIGKNLFSNVYRFVDVMRGLNKNLLPLLKRIQRACSGAQHVLDAGCGSGLISFAVKCADPNGPEMVATDRSRAMSALVQEKNNTFAGLIKNHNNNNNTAAAPPLVQFVLGDLSASPDRFIILPAGASTTEVAVEGRKQFDVMLCIDVLSYLPTVEAMKRALFNLALHAKPKAKLLLSVPNLLSCADDATKLSANSSIIASSSNHQDHHQQRGASSFGGVGGNNNNDNDAEQRPKIQRSLHFQYDRHKLSLGSSTYLSQGGVLDVIERQYYDFLTLSSEIASSMNGTQKDAASTGNVINNNNNNGKTPTSTGSSSSANKTTSSPATTGDAAKRLLKRHTEWFGFSCPNAQSFATHSHQHTHQSQAEANAAPSPSSASSFHPNSNTGEGTPQIFYESLEELILHPTVLETIFEDMGWKVEEVWLFNALERGGEFADPGINTLAVLGGVPGGSSAFGIGKNVSQSQSNNYHNLQNQSQSSLNHNESSQLIPPSTLSSQTSLSSPSRPQMPAAANTATRTARVGFDDEATNANNNGDQFANAKSAREIEASFTHRLYTLVRKTF